MSISGNCDIQAFTSVGLETSFHHRVALQEGFRYFVTVEATNGAGFKETAVSDGVTFDTSPPTVGHIRFEALISEDSKLFLQSDPQEILFSWTAITDDESGVWRLLWCAGSSAGKDDLAAWTPVDLAAWSISHVFSNPLKAGTVLFVSLKAFNGAGLTSQVTSGALMIDSTPPLQGNVAVGNTPGIYYLRQGEPIKAEWSGFVDGETGVRHYEWAVCHGFSTSDCITPYVHSGKGTSVTTEALGQEAGVSYVFVVRAYNDVYLLAESVSNPFILLTGTPRPGLVFDGDETGEDIAFQSSASIISANWQAFSDPHGRIERYEMCVGSEPEVCDIAEFQDVGMNVAGSIGGLQLNHTAQYFVTIQAFDQVGFSEMASSNGVQLDATPPRGKEARDGRTLVDLDLQPGDNFISANWNEFEDPESGIVKYTWCAGTKQGSCDVIPETGVGDSTTAGQQVFPALTAGTVVFVTVKAHNGAGATTQLFTDGVKVDSTAPSIRQVGRTAATTATAPLQLLLLPLPLPLPLLLLLLLPLPLPLLLLLLLLLMLLLPLQFHYITTLQYCRKERVAEMLRDRTNRTPGVLISGMFLF